MKKFLFGLWLCAFPLLVMFSFLDMRGLAVIAEIAAVPGWWICIHEFQQRKHEKTWETRNELPRI